MSMYDGIECPVCGKKFMPEDDVVICPECGTPHHRECYNQNGKCINEAWHSEGKVWEQAPTYSNTNNTATTSDEYVRCANCGTLNPATLEKCGKCGTPLTNNSSPLDAEETENIKRLTTVLSEVFDTKDADKDTFDSEGNVSNADLADFVGPSNFNFLLKFNMIHKRNAYPFNWSAFIFGFPYFFYRKMYKVGAIILALTLVTIIPSFYISFTAVNEAISSLVAQNIAITLENVLISVQNLIPTLAGASGLLAISNLLKLALKIFCAMFFNRMYLKHCTEKIQKIKSGFGDTAKRNSPLEPTAYSQALRVNGGVSPLSAVISVLAYYIVFVVISFASSMFSLLA